MVNREKAESKRAGKCSDNLRRAQSLSGKKIAIVVTNGFGQVELTVPYLKLKDAGATVDVISPERERIRGWNHTDWGDYVGSTSG